MRDGLSATVLLPAGRAVRRLRPQARAEALAFAQGLQFRERASAWPEERRRSWLVEAVRRAVRRAAHTRFYSERFRAAGFDPRSDFDLAEFALLPPVSAAEVREHGASLRLPSVPSRQLEQWATGGSTGEPTRVWAGPEERGWVSSASEFFMRGIGAGMGVRTALLWGHHLDPVNSDRWQDRLHAFVCNYRWFDCFRLSPEMLDQYHAEFTAYRPDVMVAYASALGFLAEHVLERGYRPDYPRRCFVTGAEKLSAAHRRAIEAAFGRPVHERYGGRDVGLLAFQRRPWESLALEVDWANVLVEPEHEGSLAPVLVTKLHADAMPLLRYRVGDLAKFPAGARPGEPAFTLQEVVGRETERLWLPGGGWVDGHQIPHLAKDYAIREYALEQAADYSVELFVVPQPRFDEQQLEALRAVLQSSLRDVPLRVSVVERVPRTPAGKLRPVVSHVAR